MRRELPRHRGLEALHALVGRSVAVLAQHRPQRLALVHRDHREGAALAGERVEGHGTGTSAGTRAFAAMTRA